MMCLLDEYPFKAIILLFYTCKLIQILIEVEGPTVIGTWQELCLWQKLQEYC